MAYGQIDPARLEGEALRRWYLRSPDEIEDERQAEASRAYDAFFSRHVPSTEVAPRSAHQSWNAGAARYDAGDFQTAATSEARQPRSHTTPESCIGCHGHFPPPPLPPPFGTFPFPSGALPFLRDIPGGLPSDPGGSDKKQCEMQYQNDGRICAGQPKPQDVAICRASASKRLAHCNANNGEVGTPDLDTAKRLRGR